MIYMIPRVYGRRRSATLSTGRSTYRSNDQANERQTSQNNASDRNHDVGSWNGTASSDNFPNIFILPNPFNGRIPRGSCPCLPYLRVAVLTFWLGHVHALTVSHKLVITSANKSGFTLEKYSTWLYR